MVDHWLEWCVMEVSSHALDQGRIDGLSFEAAVWTNLGSDHLDYHKTVERYAAAKRRIFTYLKPGGPAIINVDDPYGRSLLEPLCDRRTVTYGVEPLSPNGAGSPLPPAMVRVRQVACGWQGLSVVLESPWGVFPVSTSLVGRHNVANILAAATTCLALGVPTTAIQQGVANFAQVPGRMECLLSESGVRVVIDYAHTADALRLVLLALRELVRGRLIVVFGCGGDRDHTKRQAMGQVASLLADAVILTSDNPRSEDPLEIIHQITSGVVPGSRDVHAIVDREQAILTALSFARPDDVVLIAGKGHEAYQIFAHTTVPFSDRQVVERQLVQVGKVVAVV